MEIHSAFSGLGVGEEHGVPEETERVRIDRLVRSLGVNSDELQALDISIEETNRPPSTILRRVERQSRRWFDLFWWSTPEIDQRTLAISLFFEAVDSENPIRWRRQYGPAIGAEVVQRFSIGGLNWYSRRSTVPGLRRGKQELAAGTLTPLIMVRIQVPQPGSRVSGVLFPDV
jgi:hypothetical protein